MKKQHDSLKKEAARGREAARELSLELERLQATTTASPPSGKGREMKPSEQSPEVAYKFFCMHFDRFPGVEGALKKALLLPSSTPEMVADIIMKSNDYNYMGMDRGDIRVFTIKALEYMQFLAQVEAGTYEGDVTC